jgi:hypothetical protein
VHKRAPDIERAAATFALVAILLPAFLFAFTARQIPLSAQTALRPEEATTLIYSDDPADSWNRIFSCMFTRHVEARLSNDFAVGAPFKELANFFHLQVSTRLFERQETGDRAIDPLYAPPSYSPEGSRQLLTEPRYSALTAALQEALREPAPRPVVARSMMQSDLWSAYDLLYWPLFPEDRDTELDRHKQIITDLIGQLIVKLALTQEEIQSLPDSFDQARSKTSLPDLFNPNSGWFEFQYIPDRMHDEAAGFRRVTRLFVKATHPPRDKKKFLGAFQDDPEKAYAQLDGVALIIQPLLIDTHGNLSPTHLTTDVQVRLFAKTSEGAFVRTDLKLGELSRRLMLSDPTTGGLMPEDENSPAYLSSGGEYGFASPVSIEPNDNNPSPILAKQRTRCSLCHDTDLTTLMSFNFARPPRTESDPITIFVPAAHQAADYVISRKLKRPDWRLLHACFVPSSSTRH